MLEERTFIEEPVSIARSKRKCTTTVSKRGEVYFWTVIFDIWSILLIASASQCLFLILLFLVRPSQNRRATTLLIILLVVLLAITLNNIGYASYFYLQDDSLAGFAIGMPLLLGPLFYLYTLAVVNQEFRFRKLQILHLIPYVIVFIMVVKRMINGEDDMNRETLEAFLDGNMPVGLIGILRFALYILHLAVYLWFARRTIAHFRSTAHRDFTVSLDERRKWLEQLTVFLIVFIGLLAYHLFLMITTGLYSAVGNFVMALVFSCLVYFIAFKSILNARQADPGFDRRYKHVNLKEEKGEELAVKLAQALGEEKLFRYDGLTIGELATKMEVPAHTLSAYINDRLGKTFFELINEYRIEEFKRLAQSPDFSNYSIMGLAEESGFKSKSSFNTAFKKVTGTTPSSYLGQVRK